MHERTVNFEADRRYVLPNYTHCGILRQKRLCIGAGKSALTFRIRSFGDFPTLQKTLQFSRLRSFYANGAGGAI